ncbi:MAG TPA: carboxypeptidase-like regulatory domain-containing protein, partial [Polyangia bacterium]
VDNGHSVGGHVRDHEGRAVAGAVVTVSLPPHFLAGLTYKKTVSNQDGSYLVEGVLPGVLKLSAKREAFMSLNDHAITLTDHDLRGVDLAVERPAIIEGQIVGADSRAANVEVSGRALDARWNRQMVVGLKATPDAEGRFQLVVMPARVTLTAVDRAHNTRAAIDLGPLVAGETRKILLRLTAPGVGRVAGKVLDADGRPRADTAVSIHRNDFQATTRTDGKGQFVIERLDAGAYYLFAQHDEDNGHLLAWNSAQVDVKLAAGETRSDLVLKLPPVAELVGVVLDPRGQPFVGATVLANPEERGRLLAGPSRRTTSDETGRFRLVNLPPMPHRVTAMHGAHPAVVVRAVMPGRAEIALRFAPAVHLSGVVIEEGGRPVSDYLLRVIGPAGDESRSIHDPDGRFHWLPSAVGAYTVSAFTASGQWGAADVKIAAGEAGTHVKVTVAPPADVRLRIIDAATGSAIEGADVRVSTEMSVQTKASDREGNVTCDGLPRTGFVDVQIEAAGYQPRGKRLDLPPKSQTDPVIIELKRQSGSRPAVDQRAD